MLPPQFRVAAVLERENTADILVTRDGSTLSALPAGARLGTSSSRRRFQALQNESRTLTILPLRGNVDTRLARVADGSFDAIIIAMAGVKRLGRVKDVKFVELDARDFIPAGGQGALAIETLRRSQRTMNSIARSRRSTIARAFYETAAERAFLAAIDASCTTPVGVQGESSRAIRSRSRQCCSVPTARANCRSRWNEPLARDFAPSAAENAGKRLAEKCSRAAPPRSLENRRCITSAARSEQRQNLESRAKNARCKRTLTFILSLTGRGEKAVERNAVGFSWWALGPARPT